VSCFVGVAAGGQRPGSASPPRFSSWFRMGGIDRSCSWRAFFGLNRAVVNSACTLCSHQTRVQAIRGGASWMRCPIPSVRELQQSPLRSGLPGKRTPSGSLRIRAADPAGEARGSAARCFADAGAATSIRSRLTLFGGHQQAAGRSACP